jgi:hypothetical protein
MKKLKKLTKENILKTLGFGKKHYKCVSGINSTFVNKKNKKNKKNTKGNINQIPWNLERNILSI